MPLVFGSPEANKVLERNKELGHHSVVDCSRCRGLGIVTKGVPAMDMARYSRARRDLPGL